MRCSEFQSQLSAYIDDELTADQARAIGDHLDGCPQCQQQWAELVELDRRLEQLSIPQELPSRLVANLQSRSQAGAGSTAVLSGRGGARWIGWTLAVAIAASIILAVALMPPPRHGPSQTGGQAGSRSVVANIVHATGDVGVRPSGESGWRSVAARRGESLSAGSQLRTPKGVLCELETVDRSRIRVDGDAELIVHRPDRVEVVRGQVWIRADDTTSLQVVTAGGVAEMGATEDAWTISCPSATELQMSVGPNQLSCSSLGASQTQWKLGTFTCPVDPGETVTVDPERNIRREPTESATAKAWQLPLLAIEPSAEKELSSVLQPLLAAIGQSKAAYLHEQQIRALGPAGALPLLAYVLDEASREQSRLRHNAMRLATESADHSAESLLQQLITDEDPYVADAAKTTLARLNEAKPDGGQSGGRR